MCYEVHLHPHFAIRASKMQTSEAIYQGFNRCRNKKIVLFDLIH